MGRFTIVCETGYSGELGRFGSWGQGRCQFGLLEDVALDGVDGAISVVGRKVFGRDVERLVQVFEFLAFGFWDETSV